MAAIGALAVLALPVLPPEHVHAHSAGGDHNEVVHRHYHSHLDAGMHSHDGVESPASVDDHDGPDVRWISALFTGAVSTSQFHPQYLLVVVTHEDQPSGSVSPVLRDVHDSGHDPPWSRSLAPRAPPHSRPA